MAQDGVVAGLAVVGGMLLIRQVGATQRLPRLVAEDRQSSDRVDFSSACP